MTLSGLAVQYISLTPAPSNLSWICMLKWWTQYCFVEFHVLCAYRYDGDTFIEEVTTDFVVWELKGRTDFGYNATAMGVSPYHTHTHSDTACSQPFYDLQVKCLSAPLNWVDLLENGTHPSLAWTPLVHLSCNRILFSVILKFLRLSLWLCLVCIPMSSVFTCTPHL